MVRRSTVVAASAAISRLYYYCVEVAMAVARTIVDDACMCASTWQRGRVYTLRQTTNATPETMCTCSNSMRISFNFAATSYSDKRRSWVSARGKTASTVVRRAKADLFSPTLGLAHDFSISQSLINTIHINYLIWSNRCALNHTTYFAVAAPFLHCLCRPQRWFFEHLFRIVRWNIMRKLKHWKIVRSTCGLAVCYRH